MYLEDNTTIYPEAGNKGLLEGHKETKPIFWTSTYPAELEERLIRHVFHLAIQRVM